jgi:hypothetical protein
MGPINLQEPTLVQELLTWMVLPLLLGIVAALICLFKDTVPPFLKSISKGVIPLAIPSILLQGWEIVSDPKQREMESASPIQLTIFVFGLLSWIYLLRRKDRHA